MITHVDPEVVTTMIGWLKDNYQTQVGTKVSMMSVTRGKIHYYLGVSYNFTTVGQVQVTMCNYTTNLIDEFPDPKMKRHASTPASIVLFQVREQTESLDTHKEKNFKALLPNSFIWPKELDQILQPRLPF